MLPGELLACVHLLVITKGTLLLLHDGVMSDVDTLIVESSEGLREGLLIVLEVELSEACVVDALLGEDTGERGVVVTHHGLG